MEKSGPILAGDVKCVVNGCSTRRFSKPQSVRLFSMPKILSDDWTRVIAREENWVPKKSSKICSLHFTRGDITGHYLRPGAIPVPSLPLLFVKSGKGKSIIIFYFI